MSTSLTQQESEYKWRRTESSRDESIAIFLSDMKHEMRNIISRRREKSDVKSVTVRILHACMILKILNFPRKTKVLLISLKRVRETQIFVKYPWQYFDGSLVLTDRFFFV